MKIIITASFFLSATCFSFSQTINGRLQFEQGQTVNIVLAMKSFITQQAGGQAIDFMVDASGEHFYKITNATTENNTLHHQFQCIRFNFDGWGRKMNFDSKNETDLNGIFGGPVKEILGKSYDIIIDTSGKVLMALPEKIQLGETDSRMAIIYNLMKDIFGLVQPPQKDKASFFKVLPDKEVTKGNTWTESWQNGEGKFDAAYGLTDITDSTIVIDFATSSATMTKAEIMGTEATTTLNNKSTGQIILDRTTGIMKEKNETIESSGTTVSSFGTLPVSSKTNVTTTVRWANNRQ